MSWNIRHRKRNGRRETLGPAVRSNKRHGAISARWLHFRLSDLWRHGYAELCERFVSNRALACDQLFTSWLGAGGTSAGSCPDKIRRVDGPVRELVGVDY